MTDYEPIPDYGTGNVDSETARRARVVAQSMLSVDKPGVAHKPGKSFRIRNMKVRPKRGRRKMRDRRHPEFY